MGDSLSIPGGWPQDSRYDKARQTFKCSDKDTQKMVEEFIQEQDRLKHEKEQLQNQIKYLENEQEKLRRDKERLEKENKKLMDENRILSNEKESALTR